MRERKKSPWIRLSKLIFAGAAAIGPLVGTIWLVYAIYKLLLRVGDSMVDSVWAVLRGIGFDELPQPDFWGVQLLHFVLPIIVLLCVGVLLANPAGRHMRRAMEAMLTKLPLVGFIYKSLSQFVAAIQDLGGGERKFKSVVFVEYPSPGCRLIGFVTGEFQEHAECEGVTSVFVPTSPNPLTGFLLLIENDKIQASDMSVEEATKLVLSAGLVTPKK